MTIADEAVLAALARVSTATLSSQLRRRGLEGCTMDGLRPARSGARLVGMAKTLRYLPLREDLFAERGGGMNAQKRGIEEIRPGEVLVIEALADAEEQERQERFIAVQVRKGASIAGLYPLGPDWRDAYEKWCRQEGEE